MRCSKCNVPHAQSDSAAKNGGVGRLLEWDDGVCPICQDWREERQEEARMRYLWYFVNDQDDKQRDLDDWTE